MSLEILPFRPAAPRFGLWCDDASLQIAPRSRDRFFLTGRVEHVFPLGTTLHFRAGEDETEVPLALGSRAPDALRALTRALPRGIFVDAHSNQAGTELSFTETVIPAARRPRVQVLTTDLGQRVKMLDANQVEFLGATRSRCFVTLLVDARRSTLNLDQGTSAIDTAAAVASRCPFGYRAEVDGAVVTFWKNSDSTRIAA
ncbi:MAG: hypothetical protein H6Q89_1270 [Myxococcaceae bacterium]|nr:hypothetical protein [Myxococcaceae bacterium]